MLSMLCLGPLVEKQPVSPSWGGWGLILPSPQAAASCCYILWALAQSLTLSQVSWSSGGEGHMCRGTSRSCDCPAPTGLVRARGESLAPCQLLQPTAQASRPWPCCCLLPPALCWHLPAQAGPRSACTAFTVVWPGGHLPTSWPHQSVSILPAESGLCSPPGL